MAALGLHCCMWAFSSCGEHGLLFVVGHGLLIAVASLVAEHRLQVRRLQQLWHAGSVVVACGLQSAGLVAPQPVGSSGTRGQTHVPCIGRCILKHCATREVQQTNFDLDTNLRKDVFISLLVIWGKLEVQVNDLNYVSHTAQLLLWTFSYSLIDISNSIVQLVLLISFQRWS